MFIKCHLDKNEIAVLKLETFDIPIDRLPNSSTWNWAFDEINNIYFTQLISKSIEMREGWYWCLLIIDSKPIIVELTGHRTSVRGQSLENAWFLDCGIIYDYDINQLIAIINQAATILCHDQQPFHFMDEIAKPIMFYPSLEL